jgi:hypothetical protein
LRFKFAKPGHPTLVFNCRHLTTVSSEYICSTTLRTPWNQV